MAGPLDNNNSWQKKRNVKGAQMFIADVVGNAAEIIFLRYQESLDKALPFMKKCFKATFYVPMKAAQKPVEWVINNFAGSIEGEEGRTKRKNQNEEERLDGLLDAAYHYSSALAVGWGSLVVAEKAASRMMKTPELPHKMWTRLDLPVHCGIAAFLGSSMMKPATGTMKDLTKKVMVAAGWSEDKAEQDSRFALAYIVPNYLTLIPTVAAIGGLYKAESQGILKDIPKKGMMGAEEHHFVPTGKELPSGWMKIAQWAGIIGKAPAHSVA